MAQVALFCQWGQNPRGQEEGSMLAVGTTVNRKQCPKRSVVLGGSCQVVSKTSLLDSCQRPKAKPEPRGNTLTMQTVQKFRAMVFLRKLALETACCFCC